MKKILTSLVMTVVSLVAQAQPVINVVWPFSISSADANMVRALIDQTNQPPSIYKFVFLSKFKASAKQSSLKGMPGLGSGWLLNLVASIKRL